MGEIEETARAIGRMLKESAQYSRFTVASKSLQSDQELLSLLGLLNDKQSAMDDKMRKCTPVGVDEKRELRELVEKARVHPVYAEYQTAEREYLALMKRVNDAMNEAIGGEDNT